MNHRVTDKVARPSPVSIEVDGQPVTAYAGESIATALLASGTVAMNHDSSGRRRGPFCNMGVCCDCIVLVEDPGRPGSDPLRVRSCLATVRDGLRVTTAARRDAAS